MDRPLTELPGVGPARAAALARLGLSTLRDLLLCAPARATVWEGVQPVASARLRAGQDVQLAVRVSSWRLLRLGGRRSLLRAQCADDSGPIEIVFFNQPWLRERMRKDALLEVFGRLQDDGKVLVARRLFGGAEQAPRAGQIALSYPAGEGLSGEFLARLCGAAARAHAGRMVERLPREELETLGLSELPRAVRALHAPSSPEEFAAARTRVDLEAALRFEARMAARRRARERSQALEVRLSPSEERALAETFPFRFTPAQARAVADIARDLAEKRPMRRLLQGDVGSGKTAVGLWTCLAVARSGAQVAFLAPTELLAEQHFALARERCARHGLRAELLVGSLPGAARARVERELARGTVAIAFGTHALLGQRARFARLALAVIDEQHRFGVVQRSALLEKGLDAHALFMTATPIPRTLGLCLYGDLDVSVLAERPAGRGKLETRWLRGAALRALPRLLAERLERGERAFWVVPRIESATGAIGAKERCERLQKLAELSRHGIELVHGRLEAGERAARIERFQRGASKLLVATTVIEVGVDVSAATAMVIEGADRLGLAQLHQLRGRVGRGAGDSVCFLLGSAGAAERLEFLEREHDGFVVAEEDLRRRGMGDLAGLRQAGLSLDGVGAVLGDARLGPRVRQWIARDPELAEHYFAAHGGAGRERASAPAARHDAG